VIGPRSWRSRSASRSIRAARCGLQPVLVVMRTPPRA
jgi:hypothetical protein